MRHRESVEIYTGDRDDPTPLPKAKVKLTGGMRPEDIFGRCPPEEFEGFEEAIRALRRGFAPEEPKA